MFSSFIPGGARRIPECRDHMPMKETPTPIRRLVLDNVASFRHVDTVKELSNILVAHSADLLNVGGTL